MESEEQICKRYEAALAAIAALDRSIISIHARPAPTVATTPLGKINCNGYDLGSTQSWHHSEISEGSVVAGP